MFTPLKSQELFAHNYWSVDKHHMPDKEFNLDTCQEFYDMSVIHVDDYCSPIYKIVLVIRTILCLLQIICLKN